MNLENCKSFHFFEKSLFVCRLPRLSYWSQYNTEYHAIDTKKSAKSTVGGSQSGESVTRTPSQKNKQESRKFNFTMDNESVTEDNGKGTRKKKIDPAYDYYH